MPSTSSVERAYASRFARRSDPGIRRTASHILDGQVQGDAMPSLMAPERTSENSRVGGALSWRKLAAAVRRQARTQPDQAADLLEFANLLEGFAELEEGA